MHHSATQNFQPVVAFPEANFALIAFALNVDFERRLGEWEVRRTKTHLHAVDFEECLAELFKYPFQMTQMRSSVDDKALDLMKHRSMRLIRIDELFAERTTVQELQNMTLD